MSPLYRVCPALAALAIALSACAAGNTGAKLRVDHIALPSFAAPPAVNLPPACPADLSADLPSEPKPAGGFPAPETPAASAEVQTYFTWLATYAHWARAGWDRAASAKAYCAGQP